MTIRKIWLVLPALALGGALVVLAGGSARAAVKPLNNDCSAGYVAFTFDDGPGRKTPAVLNALGALHLKATFFVLGRKLDRSAASRRTMRAELAGGFSVQNHTYDHASFTGTSTETRPLTETQVTAELDHAATSIMSAGGPRPTLYRPPYGDVNAYYDLIAQRLGYRIVMPWGTPRGNIVDSRDWTGISPAAIAANVIRGYTKRGNIYTGIRAGAIVSMHDGEDQTALNSVEALQPIVNYMNAHHLCSTKTIRNDATGGIVSPPAPPEPTTGNLVQNPSLEALRPVNSTVREPLCFEQGAASGDGNTARWTLTTDAHSGTVAERVDVTNWTAGDRKLVLTQRKAEQSCLATVTPGRAYSMWAWYKGSWAYSGPSPTKVSIVSYYRNAAGTWVFWQSSPFLAPSSTWSLASFNSAPLPKGTTAISFGLAIHGPGTLTTDDYALIMN